MGVANEERANLILDAEIDHLPDSFVPKIAHAPLDSATNLVLRPLELLPTTGVLLAAALLFGELAELFTPLPFKTADTTPGHDQGLARVRGDGGQVDFPQVNGRLGRAGRPLCLRNLDAHVQLKAVVPRERTSTATFRQIEG
jgi:hypothetical protein